MALTFTLTLTPSQDLVINSGAYAAEASDWVCGQGQGQGQSKGQGQGKG